jgi:hypothetical protein
MLELNVKNESLRLQAVVLEPPLAMVLCQQWQRHTTKIVRAHFSGTYPEEIDMVAEMDAFNKDYFNDMMYEAAHGAQKTN